MVDDSNPQALASFLKEKEVAIFVGGVKERPITYKPGGTFCDHNQERQELSGQRHHLPAAIPLTMDFVYDA